VYVIGNGIILIQAWLVLKGRRKETHNNPIF